MDTLDPTPDAPGNRPATQEEYRQMRLEREAKALKIASRTSERPSLPPGRNGMDNQPVRTFQMNFKRSEIPPPPAPELSPLTDCETCHGMGFVTRKLPVGHPDFGRAFPCPLCGGGPNVGNRVRQNLADHFGDVWLYSSAKLHQHTMQDFLELPDHLYAGKDRAINAAYEWGQRRGASFLLLSGIYGTGKTCLASAAYCDRTDVGLPIDYTRFMNWLLHLQRSDGDLFGALQAAGRAPVLFLDDFGRGLTERETQGRQRWLFEIINTRYNDPDQLPMVLTTNYTLKELYQRFDTATMDRIVEYAVIEVMEGELPRFAHAAADSDARKEDR